MFGGLNPKKMQAVMKQMGIGQQEIDAAKVTIEKTDGSKIIIENPSVTRISMQGQNSFQISGEEKEENSEPTITDDDIKTVIGKTSCTEEQARKTLEKTNGDLAEAIIELS